MKRTRAFTLLEILVVISIIIFLIGVLGLMLLGPIKVSRIKATRALIAQISIALTQYEAEFKALPPDSGFDLPKGSNPYYDSGSLWRYLGQPVTNSVTGKTIGPLISFPAEALQPYMDSLRGPSFIVVDVWNMPLGYIGDRRRAMHNRGGVDVFSCGPDKLSASNDGIDNGKLFNVSNTAYDGAGSDDAGELGESALNGTLPDDLNNWDGK